MKERGGGRAAKEPGRKERESRGRDKGNRKKKKGYLGGKLMEKG